MEALIKKRFDGYTFYFKNGEPDYTVFQQKLSALKLASSVSNATVLLRDFYNKNYPYFSKFPLHLTGYTEEELTAFGDSIFLMLLPEKDLIFLRKVEEEIYQFVYTFPKERRSHHVVTISLHFKHKDGSLVPIYVYITPFLFDDDSNVWMTLTRISIGKKSPNLDPVLYFDLLDSKERYTYNNITEAFEIIQRPHLTHMEKSVLVLSIRGYFDKEIAEKLSLSINTIKTHKRNFLRKLEAENVSEAFIMSSLHKLI